MPMFAKKAIGVRFGLVPAAKVFEQDQNGTFSENARCELDRFADCEDNYRGLHFANFPDVTKPGNKGHAGFLANEPRKLATKSGRWVASSQRDDPATVEP